MPPRRGGIRQRMARAAEPASAVDDNPIVIEDGRSHLVHYLLGEFYWGDLPAPKLQRIAAAAVNDFVKKGAEPPQDLAAMANLGSSGAYPGKINQQLREKFRLDRMTPPASHYQLPLLRRVGAHVAYLTTTSILLPHVLFSALYHDFREQFEKLVMPGKDILRRFWASQADNPALAGHPITRSGPNYRCFVINCERWGVRGY